MSKSVNKFSRKVRDAYNQNVMNKGLKIPAGIYRGFVVEIGDSRNMGRIKSTSVKVLRNNASRLTSRIQP